MSEPKPPFVQYKVWIVQPHDLEVALNEAATGLWQLSRQDLVQPTTSTPPFVILVGSKPTEAGLQAAEIMQQAQVSARNQAMLAAGPSLRLVSPDSE